MSRARKGQGFEAPDFEMLCVALGAQVLVAEIFNSVAGVKKSPNPGCSSG